MIAACLGDPLGPGDTVTVRRVGDGPDSALIGAPGRPLPAPVTFEAIDGAGRPVAGASVQWTTFGENGRVEQASTVTAPNGRVQAIWILGTHATEEQRLTATVRVGRHEASASLVAVANPVEISSVSFRDETTTVKLGIEMRLAIDASDPFGNRFVPKALTFSASDTTLSIVDSTGTVRAHRRGYWRIVVTAGSASDTAWVHAIQIVQSIIARPDTLFFHALGQADSLDVKLVDDQGLTVVDSLPQVSHSVPGVVQVQVGTPFVVRSVSKGATALALSVGAITHHTGVVVDQRVVSMSVSSSHLTFDALGDTTRLRAQAWDHLGQPITDEVVAYSSTDTTIAKVGSDGLVASKGSGETWVYARADTIRDSVRVTVVQQVARVVTANGVLFLDALQAVVPMQATALDRLGSPLIDAVLTYSAQDSNVVAVGPEGTVRALANGVTGIVARAGVDSTVVRVVVQQAPASIHAAVTYGKPILTLPVGSLIPLSCTVFDRNGYPLASGPAAGPSSTGTTGGADCGSLRVQHSGLDTLHLTAGSIAVRVPIVVAAGPSVSSPLGDFLVVDSLPSGTFPWAPSARINSRGQLEVYAGLGLDLNPAPPSDLHRLVSDDRVHFRYDGLVLQHDPDPCGLNGAGVENIAVVPSQDGPGWRMYYASGSSGCYGWQVFSATSTDERTWTKEPGVRVSNGGPLPPDAPATPPWPAGEGMFVERLPSGEWRMIVSTYEHILPRVDKWQITEWRSPNQLDWIYHDTVLTTRQMPAEGQASVYSPTLREFAPGLWRMIFTGDNRWSPDGRSRLWSAVSTDKVHWQVEGELMGAPGTNLYYAALAEDRLVFIRQDTAQPLRLGIATVQMP